jgi:hypothetical protein
VQHLEYNRSTSGRLANLQNFRHKPYISLDFFCNHDVKQGCHIGGHFCFCEERSSFSAIGKQILFMKYMMGMRKCQRGEEEVGGSERVRVIWREVCK